MFGISGIGPFLCGQAVQGGQQIAAMNSGLQNQNAKTLALQPTGDYMVPKDELEYLGVLHRYGGNLQAYVAGTKPSHRIEFCQRCMFL